MSPIADAATVRTHLEQSFDAPLPALRQQHAQLSDPALGVCLHLYDSLVGSERAVRALRGQAHPPTDIGLQQISADHDFLADVAMHAISRATDRIPPMLTPAPAKPPVQAAFVPRPPLTGTLVRDCAALFQAMPNTQALSSNDLAELLCRDRGHRWSQHGPRGLTTHVLARLLKPAGITPRPVEVRGGTVRGYKRSDFLPTAPLAQPQVLPLPGIPA
ncbi:DUF3631 domain-containing protein [Streptacidiphilus sp. MAP5-52]|uniref:DUF3631 domain-containing protein n=1 Tax=Streptacidiphilus sp. MAP5-52 TaxID=3156267 RepID=UPI0035120164